MEINRTAAAGSSAEQTYRRTHRSSELQKLVESTFIPTSSRKHSLHPANPRISPANSLRSFSISAAANPLTLSPHAVSLCPAEQKRGGNARHCNTRCNIHTTPKTFPPPPTFTTLFLPPHQPPCPLPPAPSSQAASQPAAPLPSPMASKPSRHGTRRHTALPITNAPNPRAGSNSKASSLPHAKKSTPASSRA